MEPHTSAVDIELVDSFVNDNFTQKFSSLCGEAFDQQLFDTWAAVKETKKHYLQSLDRMLQTGQMDLLEKNTRDLCVALGGVFAGFFGIPASELESFLEYFSSDAVSDVFDLTNERRTLLEDLEEREDSQELSSPAHAHLSRDAAYYRVAAIVAIRMYESFGGKKRVGMI